MNLEPPHNSLWGARSHPITIYRETGATLQPSAGGPALRATLPQAAATFPRRCPGTGQESAAFCSRHGPRCGRGAQRGGGGQAKAAGAGLGLAAPRPPRAAPPSPRHPRAASSLHRGRLRLRQRGEKTSSTGGERERGERCLPPTHPPRLIFRGAVPAGPWQDRAVWGFCVVFFWGAAAPRAGKGAAGWEEAPRWPRE